MFFQKIKLLTREYHYALNQTLYYMKSNEACIAMLLDVIKALWSRTEKATEKHVN